MNDRLSSDRFDISTCHLYENLGSFFLLGLFIGIVYRDKLSV